MIVVWHRPPVRPMVGYLAATWCSWNRAGSDVWMTPRGTSVVALASSDEAVGVVYDVIIDRWTGPWPGAGQVGVEVSDGVAVGQP